MKLNITDTVLDKLGFTDYWDEDGDWGGRILKFSDGNWLRIIEHGEIDDDSYGHTSGGRYIANHYSFAGFFALPPIQGNHDLFFLHEMYQCIKMYYSDSLEEFENKCRDLKMGVYIDDNI